MGSKSKSSCMGAQNGRERPIKAFMQFMIGVVEGMTGAT